MMSASLRLLPALKLSQVSAHNPFVCNILRHKITQPQAILQSCNSFRICHSAVSLRSEQVVLCRINQGAFFRGLKSSSLLLNPSESRILSVGPSLAESSSIYGLLGEARLGRLGGEVLRRREFHTTPRRDIHPLLLLLIKPAAKMASIITGRYSNIFFQHGVTQ